MHIVRLRDNGTKSVDSLGAKPSNRARDSSERRNEIERWTIALPRSTEHPVRTPHFALGALILVALASSCTTSSVSHSDGGGLDNGSNADASSCPAIAACGGDPTGSWTTAGPTCGTSAPVAAQVSSDPCAQLAFDASGAVSAVMVGHNLLAVVQANVLFDSDQSYRSDLAYSNTFMEPGATEFSEACLTRSAQPRATCSELQDGLSTYLSDSAAALQSYALGAGAAAPGGGSWSLVRYENITCAASVLGGCSCTYVIFASLLDTGSWKAAGGALTLASSMGEAGEILDYCVQPGSPATLTLGAHGASSLLGLPGDGMRTFQP
jgi:hypothetical protein